MKVSAINCVTCLSFFIHLSNIFSTTSTSITKDKNDLIEDSLDEGMWSKLLVEYTLNSLTGRNTSRSSKAIIQSQLSPPPPNGYIPTNTFYITKRVGESFESETVHLPTGKIMPPISPLNGGNSHVTPPTGGINNMRPSPFSPTASMNSIHSSLTGGGPPSLREVSETDLYLLGAIEKLVYRVDYLESRIKRSEQIIYYLMEGNKQKETVNPCSRNFTKIGDNCYHIVNNQRVNWKSANHICKSYGGYLTEFESVSENEDIIAYLLNHPQYRGKDFWLGGLNPGLLWIWSNSAKPVNPNMNLTLFANSATNNQQSSSKISSKIDQNESKINDEENKILNNSLDIKGNGRCLKLSYNPSRHTYVYFGEECTSKYNFLCEAINRNLDNRIKRLAKKLNLDKIY